MSYWVTYALNSAVQLAIILFLGSEATKSKYPFGKVYALTVSIVAALNIVVFALLKPQNSAEIISVLQTVVVFGIVFINAEGSIWKKIKAVAANFAAALLTEISIILLVNAAYGVDLAELDMNDTLSTVISVLTLEIYLAWVMLILLVLRLKSSEFREMRLVCLMIAVISALFGVISIAYSIGGSDKLNEHDVFVNQITHCLITILLMVLYYAMKSNIKKVRDEEKLEAIEESVYRTHEFYTLAQQQYDDISKIRHDLRNQVQAIECLIAEKSFDEAENSLSALKNKYGELGITTYCSVPIVNVITTLKINECRENNITAEISLRDCGLLPFDNYEMCSVFSNILDNAINACKQVEDSESRHITIKSQVFGEMFVMKAENSIASARDTSTKRKGYGLEILRDTAEKYGGSYKVEAADDLFRAMLYIPVKPNM